MQLESILAYLAGYLRVSEHPDDPNAWNGLQVEGAPTVRRIAAAVDASEASILEAAARGADLLIVHHGLFWGGLRPLTGRLMRRVRPLVESRISLYSCHLPLDGHPEVGNNALLARAIGLELAGRFASFQGTPIGWWGELSEPIRAETFRARVAQALGGGARLIEANAPRGEIQRVGVVTGGGGSFIPAAAAAGLDALVTGEVTHHAFFDATELGVNLVLGGHYATETFGVRALAEHLAARFELEWSFIDQPTGL